MMAALIDRWLVNTRGYQLELQALRDAPVNALRSPVGGRRAAAKQRGHAAPPGTGPAGETCGSCKHRVRKRLAAKVVSKCSLHPRPTGSDRTDVRVRDPACRKWEAKTS